MKKAVVLLILDGWGIGQKNDTNPIHLVNPQNIAYIKQHYPSASLTASGVAVGLPWGEEGNSEVGHSVIGTGKVIYQHYPRISLAIRDGSFYKNPALKAAMEHAKKNNSALNLVGLLSSGNVHSSIEHLNALLKMAKEEGVGNIKLHLMTDGRDSPPKTIRKLLEEVPTQLVKSIGGRYFGMDRDRHWDRIEKAYKILTGQGTPIVNFQEIINKHLEKTSEEYLEPMLVGGENGGIKDNEAVIFFNFREDRMRELSAAFLAPGFSEFKTVEFKNLFVATLTTYSDKYKVPIAFPPEQALNPLGKIISSTDKLQVRIAETEKYAHITYFFNGYQDAPFKNEYRVLIPSRNIERHDERPEMMTPEITNRAISLINEGAFDFILINFANPDIIAHTGNIEAAKEAVKVVDNCIGELMKAALQNGGSLVITSDHGNIERMLNPATGTVETEHDPSPVPIYLVDKNYEGERKDYEVERGERETIGILTDIAPTILGLLNLPKPDEMIGRSLLPILKL